MVKTHQDILFGSLPCKLCIHKNTATVGCGWSVTRCNIEPHKEFFEIEKDNTCSMKKIT